MHLIAENTPIKITILFNSEHGRHVIIQEFKHHEILKKNTDEFSQHDCQIMNIKNEGLLIELFDIAEEKEFVQKIRSKKYIKKLIMSNSTLLELIENSTFCENCGALTVVLVIDVEEISNELIRVVSGNHVGMVLESLNSWVDSPLWEDGVELLEELLDYLDNFNHMFWLSSYFPEDDEDSIDPRLN